MSDDLSPTSSQALKRRTLGEHTRVIFPAGVIISAAALAVGWAINSYAGRVDAIDKANIEQDRRIQSLEINAGYTQQALQAIQKTTDSINEKVERLIDEVRKRP